MYLLLALFREVTCLYREANPNLHPKSEVRRTHGDNTVAKFISHTASLFNVPVYFLVLSSTGGFHPGLNGSCKPKCEGIRPGPGSQPAGSPDCPDWDLWYPVGGGGAGHPLVCSAALWEPGPTDTPPAAGSSPY